MGSLSMYIGYLFIVLIAWGEPEMFLAEQLTEEWVYDVPHIF